MTDTLRRAILAYPSRYRLAKDCGIEQSALSRFLSGKTSFNLTTLDKLAPALGLRLVVDGPTAARGTKNTRRSGGR